MGLLAADNWVAAYSPNSQASQHAILRSIEFIFDANSGLNRIVNDEKARYPFPWHDNRGNVLVSPTVNVTRPFFCVANMVSPYTPRVSQTIIPQTLHRQTIATVSTNILNECARHGIAGFTHMDHMWDMRRLGLICDYNGIPLHSLTLGNSYPGPSRQYTLQLAGGTVTQLNSYSATLTTLARNF